LEHALLTQVDAAPAAPSFTAHMPRYLSAWPEGEHHLVELRVLLAVQLLSRMHLLRRRVVSPLAEVDDAEACGVLTDVLWATLRVEHLPLRPSPA
jgi:hypothetical protein